MSGMTGARSYEISIMINSIFKKTGVDQAIKAMHNLQKQGRFPEMASSMYALQRRTKKITQTFNELAPVAWKMGIPFKNLHSSLQNVNVVFDKTGETVDALTGNLVTNKEATRRLSVANQRFHMELLSVMFAGMALQRAMMGLLAPSRKMTGETELWGNALAIFFLPYARDSLNWAIAFQKIMFDLNKTTGGLAGRAAGWGAAFLETAGGIMMMVGQLGLAINGLDILYKKSNAFRKVADIALTFTRKGWGLITGAFGILKDWGLKGVTTVTKGLKLAFTRSGWTDKILPALSSLAGWGFTKLAALKTFTIKMIADTWDAVSTLAATTFAGYNMKTLLTKGATIVITLVFALAAWKVGEAIGMWIRETLLGGRNIAAEMAARQKPGEAPIPIPHGIVVPFQHGGIVTRPTLGMIGENGPEAVIPLNKANEYLNFSPTINITAGSNVDIDLMKSQLNEGWLSELKSGGLR